MADEKDTKDAGKSGRTPVVFHRPKAGDTLEDVVEALVQPIAEHINRQRKELGLPPLIED
jgi:hypothetical protein